MVVKLFNGEIEMLKVDDLAGILSVHKVTILRYIRAGKIKARRIGKCYYVTKENFREFTDGEGIKTKSKLK